MKIRTTLFLALVLAALAGFVYLYEIRGEKERTQAGEEAKKLLKLEADSVTSVQILPAGIELRKQGKDWEIIAPIRHRADAGTVMALLNRLEDAKRDRELGEERSQWAAFGLDPAQDQIVVVHEGRRDTLCLGEKNTTSLLVYVRRNSDPTVVLTDVAVATNARKPLFDWRDKSLISFDINDVKYVRLSTPGGRFELRREAGRWQLLQPLAAPADESKVSQILSQVGYARVREFVTESIDDPRQYGLDRPAFELTVVEGDSGAPKSLQFGKLAGTGYFAHDPERPQVFLVDTSLVRNLEVKLMDLRDKKLADFQSWQADQLTLQYGDTLTIVCAKDSAAQWQIVAPDSSRAISWKISNLTGTLASLQAVAFVDENATDLARYGLDKPRASIVVAEKGAELAHVLLGRPQGDQVHAKAANSPVVVLIRKEEADRLIVPLNELIEK